MRKRGKSRLGFSSGLCPLRFLRSALASWKSQKHMWLISAKAQMVLGCTKAQYQIHLPFRVSFLSLLNTHITGVESNSNFPLVILHGPRSLPPWAPPTIELTESNWNQEKWLERDARSWHLWHREWEEEGNRQVGERAHFPEPVICRWLYVRGIEKIHKISRHLWLAE